jgi:hypothetical protein
VIGDSLLMAYDFAPLGNQFADVSKDILLHLEGSKIEFNCFYLTPCNGLIIMAKYEDMGISNSALMSVHIQT